MRSKVLKLAASLMVVSVGTASADVTMVDCPGAGEGRSSFVISIAEAIASAGEERAGSMAEFQENVCTVAQQLPIKTYDRPTRVDILIEPYGIDTTVVVFPTAQRDSGN
jgi:hypothetical protein